MKVEIGFIKMLDKWPRRYVSIYKQVWGHMKVGIDFIFFTNMAQEVGF